MHHVIGAKYPHFTMKQRIVCTDCGVQSILIRLYFLFSVMGRVYKRKLGARRYADYTAEQLGACLNAVRAGMSSRLAAETYKIPRRTICNKLKGVHPNKPGYPQVFTQEEERRFVACIHNLSDYGFPVDEVELRHIIKTYLDRQGRSVQRFKNNLPGRDWAKSFLRRHTDLTARISSNIKRSRAALTEEQMREYIENLRETLKDVEPNAIINYDETNLTDDPGQKKIITRRGVKYPDEIFELWKWPAKPDKIWYKADVKTWVICCSRVRQFMVGLSGYLPLLIKIM